MAGNNDQHKSGERIAKVIARAGLGSRREAEGLIAAGRVAVNGAVIDSPALNVTAGDAVSVDGEPLPRRERTRLFLYHKPRGLLTARTDPRGRPTIFQRLPPGLPRLISVGRLDFNTEGLLLLTNDGALARTLELPSTGWLRRYRVRAHGSVTQAQLDALRAGITISGIHYGPIDAALDRVQGSNLWLTFAIREGKNREVRNVLGHVGLTVTRLIRVSFGPFQLGELAEGAVEEVRTRIVREQLGDTLVAQSGVDFSAPIAPPAMPPKPASKMPQARKSPDHAWRAHEQERQGKKLRRKFHGAQHRLESRALPKGKARADVLTDRRNRSIPVERYGAPPTDGVPQPNAPKRGRGGRRNRRGAPDRAFGPRPRHPKDKR